MKHNFITFKQASSLIELGLPNEKNDYMYYLKTGRKIKITLDDKDAFDWNSLIPCLTQEQAAEWLRKEKRIHISIGYNKYYKEYKPWIDEMDSEDYERYYEPSLLTYEDAFSHAIDKAIKILKK